jgi:hypothetical protein
MLKSLIFDTYPGQGLTGNEAERHQRIATYNLSSQTDLAVRAKANQIEVFIIWFTVDQDQIRLYVAVSMIRPFAGKQMIEVAAGQGHIGGKQTHDFHQGRIKLFAVPP